MSRYASLALLLLAALFLTGCAGGGGGGYYHYRYVRGKTAVVRWDGQAVAPPNAPREVHAAIAAGNQIAGKPYVWGGGRGGGIDAGYDCSGAASHILRATGRLKGTMTSSAFKKFGAPGEGEWITVYARDGHVFLVVAGLRYDTGWTRYREGPQWTEESRPIGRAVARHAPGL